MGGEGNNAATDKWNCTRVNSSCGTLSSYLTFDCGHERLLEVPDRSLATFVKLHNGLVHRDLEVVLVELLQELQVSDRLVIVSSLQ